MKPKPRAEAPRFRSWSLGAHILIVADVVLAMRLASLLWAHFTGQSWRIHL